MLVIPVQSVRMNSKNLYNFTVRKAVRKCQAPRVWGSILSDEDMKNAGDSCPICQDEFKEPIQLHCKESCKKMSAKAPELMIKSSVNMLLHCN